MLIVASPWAAANAAAPPVAATKAIQVRYDALGGAKGVLGASTSEVTTVSMGYLRTFAHGRIYYSSTTGAHEVLAGLLLTYFLKLGADAGSLGLPTGAPFDGGKGSTAQAFVKGRIYYTRATGARGVYGTTLARYRALDGARGVLGLPTVGSLPSKVKDVRVTHFQSGRIYSGAKAGGVRKVVGAINTRYTAIGAEGSWIGLPTALATKTSYGSSQSFAHAAIHYYSSTKTAQVRLAFSTSVKTPKAADVPYTYRSGCPVGPSSLRMITLTYRNWAGDDARGTIVVRSSVVGAITSVFEKAHHVGWPFRRVTPVDTYKGSDVKSMEADNTSAFNCRKVTGNPYRLSQHSYGNAIDINTYENPYVANGKVYPEGSDTYLNRKNHRKA